MKKAILFSFTILLISLLPVAHPPFINLPQEVVAARIDVEACDVSGFVEGTSKKGVRGATIKLKSGGKIYRKKSGNYGYYCFKNLSNRTYRAIVNGKGYKQYKAIINFKGKSIYKGFTLAEKRKGDTKKQKFQERVW